MRLIVQFTYFQYCIWNSTRKGSTISWSTVRLHFSRGTNMSRPAKWSRSSPTRSRGAWEHCKKQFRRMNEVRDMKNFETHLCEVIYRSHRRSKDLISTFLADLKAVYTLNGPPTYTYTTSLFTSMSAPEYNQLSLYAGTCKYTLDHTSKQHFPISHKRFEIRLLLTDNDVLHHLRHIYTKTTYPWRFSVSRHAACATSACCTCKWNPINRVCFLHHSICLW